MTSTNSCFGEPWMISNFTKLRQNGSIRRRTDDVLYLEEGLVEVSMALKVLINGRRPVRVPVPAANPRDILTLEIVVTMDFHGARVSKDFLRVDFLIACGQLRKNMDSTVLNKQNEVSENCLKNFYHCRKENLGTDASLTPNDTLTIIPIFSVSSKIVEVPIQKVIYLNTDPIKKLLEDDEFADFIFSVRGVDFKVHKAIIAVRSTVFRAMVQNDMKEKNNNRAEVTDVDPAAFKEMLRYVYTGKVENLPNVVQELIKIADKYDLPQLKSMCEDELSKGLCPNNAVELLQQADMFGCKRLKAQTIEYICRNTPVMDSDAWKNFVSSQSSTLIGEVYSKISKGKAIRYVRLPPKNHRKSKSWNTLSDLETESEESPSESD